VIFDLLYVSLSFSDDYLTGTTITMASASEVDTILGRLTLEEKVSLAPRPNE
jgi:hypothetical protein